MSEEKPLPEMLPTAKGRTIRILKLLEFIKNRKKADLNEVLKYAMNSWLISSRVVRAYLKDLEIAGYITIQSEGVRDYVIYKGDE